MKRSPALREILELDAERDCQRIVYLDTVYEFPFDTTGEFARRAQKRYDDTDLILSTIAESGYESEEGKQAIRLMNRMHRRFEIANEDFLYVLSTFVFEPIRWNARFGWRPLVEQERQAAFHFWRAIGKRMAIADIPERYDDLEGFNEEYERTRFRYAESNARVAAASRDMFLAWFPGVPTRLGTPAIAAVMDERLREAIGFPRPPRALVRTVESALRTRAAAVRLLPPRRRPKLRTRLGRRTYPRGWRLAELGTTRPGASGGG